jgi:hypothetical protein
MHRLSTETEKRIVEAATSPVPTNPIADTMAAASSSSTKDKSTQRHAKSWAHSVAGAFVALLPFLPWSSLAF